MKEAFEKIIERLLKLKKLELEQEEYIDENGMWNDCEEAFCDGETSGRYRAYVKAIEIVNQVTEEYSHRNADLVIRDSHSNDGWIPCSERLPKYDEKSEYYKSVIVTLDNGRVAEGCYRNLDKEWWVDAPDGENFSQNMTGHVLAWQPLPAPYQPKGE